MGGEPKSSKKDKKRKATGETPVEKEPKKSKSVVEGQKEEEESPRSAFAVMDSARKKKKKSKEEKVKSKPNPAFEVDSWDEPIQEGELEMVEANPKYQVLARNSNSLCLLFVKEIIDFPVNGLVNDPRSILDI